MLEIVIPGAEPLRLDYLVADLGGLGHRQDGDCRAVLRGQVERGFVGLLCRLRAVVGH